MSLEAFQSRIKDSIPRNLAEEFLLADRVHIFQDEQSYSCFRGSVSGLFDGCDHIAVVGSGNWRFSLNPNKGFREFGSHSDVDVAVISTNQFTVLWEEMRSRHRLHFYRLPESRRDQLRRDSENVYAGFISPMWIPNRDAVADYEFRRKLNRLSDVTVNYLRVKMLFFKNLTEAVDYYSRGFSLARRALK